MPSQEGKRIKQHREEAKVIYKKKIVAASEEEGAATHKPSVHEPIAGVLSQPVAQIQPPAPCYLACVVPYWPWPSTLNRKSQFQYMGGGAGTDPGT